MNKKTFEKYVERDGGCVHCGETEAISPNHRINRGMGGSKLLDRPANVVILCSNLNYLIEADYDAAKYAIQMGWKLNRHQDPEATPIYDGTKGEWFLLDNDFNRVQLDNR